VEDVREYTSLDRNDAAYVPKTVLKNGATLQLESIEWVVMGQHPVDGRMVPNLFTAVDTYAGTAIGSRATGCTATLPYTGTGTKSVPGLVVLTVTFRGEPVAAGNAAEPDTSAPATGEKENKGLFTNVALNIVIGLLVAACLAVAGVRTVRHIRAKHKRDDAGDFAVEDYYTGEDEYSEAAPARSVLEDARQAYPQDEINLDELFSGEGLFNA
jgi:hypothetical protein